MTEFDDGEGWGDEQYDAWLGSLCETILACYREGNLNLTDVLIFDLTKRGEVCENDLTIAFDFFAEVARGEVEVDADFKARVESLLNLYKP